MSIKILYVESSLKEYGGQKSLLDILLNLNTDKFKAILACSKGSETLKKAKDNGIESIELEMMSKSVNRKKSMVKDVLSSFNSSIKLFWLIRTKNIDLIHANTYKAGLISILPTKLARIPLIWHDRAPDSHGIFDRILFYSSNKIIANSNYIAKSRPYYYNKKVKIIYNAIECNESAVLQNKEDWRKKFKFSKNDFLIGTIGRITHTKGQHILIQATAKIIKKFPQIKILLIGDTFRPEDEKYKKELINLIKKLKLEGSVFLLGYQKNIYSLMKSLNITVVPSLVESFGRVIIESMAVKTSVIASRVGGIPEIIEDNQSGLLFPTNNADILVCKIQELLRDPKKCKRIAKEGHKRYKKYFSIEKMMNNIQMLYEKILI